MESKPRCAQRPGHRPRSPLGIKMIRAICQNHPWPMERARTTRLTRWCRGFTVGGEDAEVVREAMALMSGGLPLCHAAACGLLAMLSSSRIGNLGHARKLAVFLNNTFKGWDLPGIPVEAAGPGVRESKDVDSITAALDALGRSEGCTEEERAALRSLQTQYAERKKILGREDRTQRA